MAIVNERQSAAKPTQVDPKTGKPLPARAQSPSLDTTGEASNTSGFFGSFWASKNKKKMAAMEAPPPTLKASASLSERETSEVEVISTLSALLLEFGFSVILTISSRTSNYLLLQHCQAHHDRHGSQGHHVHPCAVCIKSALEMRMVTLSRIIRFTKDEMQRELLENMYRNNELDDLLKESDYTVRRRKECQQMVESLGRASEIVSQVQ